MARAVEESSIWETPARTGSGIKPRVAVILAAGRATRLSARTGGSSKAALRLGGLSLLERNVRALLQAGIERVVVVLGYDADRVERCLVEIPADRLTVVRAEGWERGNSASLMAAKGAVVGEELFLLLAADHLFSQGALQRVLAAGEPAVLVDASPGAAWEGGTKVRIVDGRVVALSKDLDDPAIDCGAFLVTPAIFDHFEAPAAKGDYSVSGMLTALAVVEPMAAVPLPAGEWWQDIDTPEDLEAASRLLRRSLQKKTDGPIARALNRPLSTRLSMLISRWRPSPMLLTVLTSGVGAVAAVVLALGEGIAGGILTQLTSVLDGVDGEIARLQFRATPKGAFLDGVLDRLGDAAIVAGLGIWCAAQGAPTPLLVALVGAATAMVILSMATKDRLELLGLATQRDTFGSNLLGGRDGRLFCAAVGGVLGQPLPALAVITLTSGIGLVARVIYVVRSGV